MPILKCKICGGDIQLTADKTCGMCEYCGCTMTLPKIDDEQRASAFNRGNHFRRSGEFDKALSVYERIVAEDDTDAEAHWCCALCRFGIEYVEDPATYEWLPTCHRASFDSFLEDVDYLAALEHSDGITRRQYQKDAAKIAEVQRGILAASQNTEPYDVFISYKELDANGNRTRDSILAQDIYYQLTEQGRRVFFSRITLEDIPGTEYEPYIFAALNSAKVMIVVGTSAENLNAVWVKNEWSRFLAMMRKDRSKLLLPCYRDMDPYDLPEQLSVLMSYDMGKIGFIQDLIRGVNKVLDASTPYRTEAKNETVIVRQAGGTSADALVKRGYMALEDGEWDKADSFFEESLNHDAECGEAYFGKLLARDKLQSIEKWVETQKQEYFDEYCEDLEACDAENVHISQICKNYEIDGYLTSDNVCSLYDFNRFYSSALACRKDQKELQLSDLSDDKLLLRAKQYAKGGFATELNSAIKEITDTLDARIKESEENDKAEIARVKNAYAQHIAECDKKVAEMKVEAEARRNADYQRAVAEAEARSKARLEKMEALAKSKAKKRKIFFLTSFLACACIVILFFMVILPGKYNAAVELMNSGNYSEAIAAFEALPGKDGYKDSLEKINTCKSAINEIEYNAAVELMNNGDYGGAYKIFASLKDYKDSSQKLDSAVALYKTKVLSSAEVGDTVLFGAYEQDNDMTNGSEVMEWIILDRKDDSILVISKYALDAVPYNERYTEVTWETCTIRKWLNNVFFDEAFSTEEKDSIVLTTVKAQKNPYYDNNPANDTNDRIFLLSFEEAENYFASNKERICIPTAYSLAQNEHIAKYENGCFWWLRTPGENAEKAACVENFGILSDFSLGVGYNGNGVRPAMWINLEP